MRTTPSSFAFKAAFSAFSTVCLAAASLGAQAQASGPSNTVTMLAKPALLGMQLSVRRGQQLGKVPPQVAQCVQSLRESSFTIVLASLLVERLEPKEVQAADEFFGTAVGKKYARHTLLQVYDAVDEKAPEALPDFSAAEYKELETFSRTSAGDKLLVRRVMEDADARQAIGSQIQSLLGSCGAKP